MSNDFIKQWVEKAEKDLKTAAHELALPQEETITETVCFHSQQAVEKWLKAYLILKNEEFGKTHNLELLLQLCGKHDVGFLQCELGNLTEYAVAVRYPSDFYVPDYEEAKNAYEIAVNMKNFISIKLKNL